MLYIRYFLIIVIGLITSRVVLQVLGVEDYGIYGIVGSVVAMMGFLNASMSGATSRFLTYELGKGNYESLEKVFSSAIIVHLAIALIVLLVCETLGYWWLNNKLVIPAARMIAARRVFHLSVLAAVIGVIQVPYTATIIAHEKIDVYAYIEIFNVLLKLLIVYLLKFGSIDRLVWYGFLTLVVSCVIFLLYIIFCNRSYKETHFRWVWDKTILYPMLSFSGWDLFGNFAVTGRQQGTNFLINMFFGVVYNAASNVATTIAGMLGGLCQNVLAAFRPRIIKLYSAEKPVQSMDLLFVAAKISTVLIVLVAIPLFFEMDLLMRLWLKNPPEYSVLFCRIMLVSSCINMCECVLNIGIHATGEVKRMSILTGCCYLGILPVIWICYKSGLPVETAYYLSYLVCTCNLLIRGYILQRLIPEFSFRRFATGVIIPIIIVALIVICITYPIVKFTNEPLRFFAVFSVDLIVGSFLAFIVVLDKNQRDSVLDFIKTRIAH